MGQEKLEAAAQSSTRMVTEAMALNQHLARLALGQMQAQTAAWSGAAVGHALVRSAAAGLKPIHGARANAKRLGRRKRR